MYVKIDLLVFVVFLVFLLLLAIPTTRPTFSEHNQSYYYTLVCMLLAKGRICGAGANPTMYNPLVSPAGLVEKR